MHVLINRFTLTGDAAEFERVLGEITEHMAQQPGFRSYALYRARDDSPVYVETAEWDSKDDHAKATGTERFRSLVKQVMPLVSVEPGSFELRDRREAVPSR
ncbi:antibiotic biosynthesis monooxygenase family protein [Amycolatopsis sp. NPDC049688]|uniref:antibiotic biosynthesis monooxygenase family protein n=1 Tax=Amycolatopsis sp. NPDC049688 TaxID=3154733 RepID=UPI0034140F4C